MGSFSDTLFARPSALEGIARILDFGNTLSEYNRAETPEEADREAFLADRCSIHADMLNALESLRSEVKAISGR